MPEKKVIDDYYAQTAQENQVNSQNEQTTKVKPKIKWRLKIKNKKPQKEVDLSSVKSENTKKTSSVESEKPSTKAQSQKPKKVVKKESESKDNANKTQIKPRRIPDYEKAAIKREEEKAKKELMSKKDPISKDDEAKKSYSDNKRPQQQSTFPTKVVKNKSDVKFNKDEDIRSKKIKNLKKEKVNKYITKKNLISDDEFVFVRSNKIKNKDKKEKKVEEINQNLVDKKGETIVIPDVLSVKEFSEKIWVPLVSLIAEFMKNWMRVTINSKIDFDTASIIWENFDVKLQKDISSWLSVEEILTWDISNLLREDDSSKLEERPPVVSIMGHVDHWKTSLLDYIRKTKVADKEAGWITQWIWAYQVDYNWKKITFLDTPWHEAFTVMRARWAKSTDIAILVVAADEWVKPQTIESINHAREAWIQIVVAINKMDKEWANPERIKTQLASEWLQPEEWGWDVPMVPISAKEWTWVDDLLEILLIASEMLELKANPDRLAVGTILESHLDLKFWPLSTVLVNTWTIKKWDYIVCKWSYGRVKVLKDHLQKNIVSWGPSKPVLVVWLDNVADGGDIVQVVSDIDKARVKAMEYKELIASKISSSTSWIDMLMSRIKSWSLKHLKIVVKSDTNGSLEAIKSSLLKLSTPETQVSIIHSWVWNITEWDVLMCQWSSAILVWYNVSVLGSGLKIIEESKIEFIYSKIIYHITERIEKIITWMLDPKEIEEVLWESKVWGIFYDDKKWFMIIWLIVPHDAKVENKSQVRIVRKGKMIWKWDIENLKQWIEDVNSIEWPTECWIKLNSKIKVEIWDILEVYKVRIEK